MNEILDKQWHALAETEIVGLLDTVLNKQGIGTEIKIWLPYK
jgi:hypothetical protein